MFNDYREHKEATVRPSLLWEYDMTDFDWQAMRNIVVQRVVERGYPDDFYAILNLYTPEGVKDAIKECPYLNRKDRNFVCVVFNLKPEELRCSTHRQSVEKHWNS